MGTLIVLGSLLVAAGLRLSALAILPGAPHRAPRRRISTRRLHAA